MVRKADVDVSINLSSITAAIAGETLSLTYTDNASESVDDIALSVENRSGKWLDSWLPNKGDSLTAKIVTQGWTGTLDCGEFIIDDVEFGGGPMMVDIKGVAMKVGSDFTETKRSRTWEKASLRGIAESLTGKEGIQLDYRAAYNPVLAFASQANQSDKSFLYDLCAKYGLTLKMFSTRVIIYDAEELEVQAAVEVITPQDLLPGWKAKTTITDTGYSSVEVHYTDPSGHLLSYRYEVKGTTAKSYSFTASVDNLAQAQRAAKAKFRELNKAETTFSGTLPGNTRMVSGTNVMLSGFGQFDGKYFIDRATHKVGGGYTTAIEAHKVEVYQEVTVSSSAPAPVLQAEGFKKGDVVAVKPGTSNYYPGSCGIPEWVKADYHHVVLQTESGGKPVVKGGKPCVLLGDKISVSTGKRSSGIMTWIAVENLKSAG